MNKQNGIAKNNYFMVLLTGLSDIIWPVVGMLCALGMLKGFLTLFVHLHILDASSGTYTILYHGADTLFYFFPVIIGYTSAKKFNLDPITGIILGLVLCAPAIVNLAPSAVTVQLGQAKELLGSFLGINYYAKLLGLPLLMPSSGNYTASVIPIILTVWFASWLEKKVKNHIPATIKNFVVPLIVFLITVPIMFLVIGPLAIILTDIIGKSSLFIFKHAPIVGGLLLEGVWQVLIIFGLQWAILSISIINIMIYKYDIVFASAFASVFAQFGAIIAVIIKTKDKELKSLGIPAAISAITAGVISPGIYGITLPKKTPFVYACIGGGCRGRYCRG